MVKHIVYADDGSTIIKEVDIEKGVTLEEMRDLHGLAGDESYRLRVTSPLSPVFTVPAGGVVITEPAAYSDGMWQWESLTTAVGDKMLLTIIADPSDGGSPITEREWRYNDGAPQPLSGAGPWTLTVIPDTEASAEVRARNSVGWGEWSDVKSGMPLKDEVAPVDEVVFGAQTLVGAGGIAVTAADGTYGEFTVSDGIISPNTTPLTVGNFDVDGVSVSVIADTASVSSVEEMRDAMRAAWPAGGITITLRGGTHDTETGLKAVAAKNGEHVFDNTVTVQLEDYAVITPSIDFVDWSNVIVRGGKFYDPEGKMSAFFTGGAPSIFGIAGACSDFTVQDTIIAGKYYDPLGDYYELGSYYNSDVGIRTRSTGKGGPGGITIERVLFEDMLTPTTISLGRPGGLIMRDLEVRRCYADGHKWSLSTPEAADGGSRGFKFHRHWSSAFTGRSSDAGNPHVDSGVQFIPNQAVDQVVIEGAEYIQVVTAEVITSRARGNQGITGFSKENDSRNIHFKDPIIAGCLILASGNHHCTLTKMSGGIVHYNTLVKAYDGEDVLFMDNRSTSSQITLFGYDDRPTSLRGNVTALSPYIGPTSLSTFVEEDNVQIGTGGDDIPYDSIFTGPFPATTLDEVKTAYTTKGIYADKGALAFGTIGSPRDPSGWTYDPDKLIPLPGSALAE